MELLPIFYRPEIVQHIKSFSPSASKAPAVLDSWAQLGIPTEIHSFAPVSTDDLKLAHDPWYVDAVFNGSMLNGFRNKDVQVAESCRYTVGAMYAAAEWALRTGLVAIAPVSGFHHANYADGYGFCTFNGLLITALMLKQQQKIQRLGILDLDVHEGDGSAGIIERLSLASWITHHSMGYATATTPEHATAYLASLPTVIEQMQDCDLVLFQASADPHIDDPLGGFLTTAELQLRDEIVFRTCQRLGLPLAWNLAGGYQRDAQQSIRPVLTLHDNTLRACAAVYLKHLEQ